MTNQIQLAQLPQPHHSHCWGFPTAISPFLQDMDEDKSGTMLSTFTDMAIVTGSSTNNVRGFVYLAAPRRPLVKKNPARL